MDMTDVTNKYDVAIGAWAATTCTLRASSAAWRKALKSSTAFQRRNAIAMLLLTWALSP